MKDCTSAPERKEKVMIVTKDEAEKMSSECKKDYCEWCFYKDYGVCDKCALFIKPKS